MTDREKLIDVLTNLEEEDEFICDSCVRVNKQIRIESLANRMISYGVMVKEQQKPLTFDQLNEDEYYWYEHNYYKCIIIEPAEIRHKRDEVCYIDFIGNTTCISHKKEYYGKIWRCWAEKPTEEEREAAKWER